MQVQSVKISEVTKIEKELVSAFGRLIPQLSSSSAPPTAAELQQIMASPCCSLLVARDATRGGEVVGSLTLVLFQIPTGLRARIEDVVVDERSRRKGIAKALTREALQKARESGAKTVDLTSRPSREAATNLYHGLGFERRSTKVFRYKLENLE